MEHDPRNYDPYADDSVDDEPMDDDQFVDTDRREGAAEDYKPGTHSDDVDVDYETRTHGDNRRI